MVAGVSRAASLVSLASLLSMAGCSIGLNGLQGDGGGTEDDSSMMMAPGTDSSATPHDAGPLTGDAARAADGSEPNPCGGPGDPCPAVPDGWALVAFAPAQSSPCPPGFDSAPASNLVEGPAAAGTCSCGACSVTTPPSCASGAVAGYYDYNASAYAGTCYAPDEMPLLSNDPPGACLSDVHQGPYATFDVRYNAPTPTGGVCSTPGVPSSGALTYSARDRVCAPNDVAAMNCSGTSCNPTLTASYEACIVAPGNVACPPGPYTVAHAVGSSGSITCADCACKITSTCSGTLTLYTDTKCQKGAYPLATGVCVDMSDSGTFEAYEYKANAPTKVSCQAGAPAAAQNVALAEPETICCAK